MPGNTIDSSQVKPWAVVSWHAIDECPNDSGMLMARKMVLELMEELVGLHFPNLCLCIMSHLEFNICNTLEPVTTQQLSLHDESRQIWDINNYITDLLPGPLPHPHLYIHPSHCLVNQSNLAHIFCWQICWAHQVPLSDSRTLWALPLDSGTLWVSPSDRGTLQAPLSDLSDIPCNFNKWEGPRPQCTDKCRPCTEVTSGNFFY